MLIEIPLWDHLGEVESNLLGNWNLSHLHLKDNVIKKLVIRLLRIKLSCTDWIVISIHFISILKMLRKLVSLDLSSMVCLLLSRFGHLWNCCEEHRPKFAEQWCWEGSICRYQIHRPCFPWRRFEDQDLERSW